MFHLFCFPWMNIYIMLLLCLECIAVCISFLSLLLSSISLFRVFQKWSLSLNERSFTIYFTFYFNSHFNYTVCNKFIFHMIQFTRFICSMRLISFHMWLFCKWFIYFVNDSFSHFLIFLFFHDKINLFSNVILFIWLIFHMIPLRWFIYFLRWFFFLLRLIFTVIFAWFIYFPHNSLTAY